MVSVYLPSDALLQHLPSYLGFSYLGHGVSLHSYSSKVQPLLLTLDEGYLLTAALPDLQCGIAPLGPPVLPQPRLWVAPPGRCPWPRAWGHGVAPPPATPGLGCGVTPLVAAPDLRCGVAPLSHPCSVTLSAGGCNGAGAVSAGGSDGLYIYICIFQVLMGFSQLRMLETVVPLYPLTDNVKKYI